MLLTRSFFGRALYASGGNPTAAVYAGIDVGRTRFLAFVLSGSLAGLCGYLWVSRYAVAYVDIANGFELDSVAACVIGGISIVGGIGTAVGAVLGALFLGVIKNALPVINISPFWQMAISGAVIIAAVIFNARQEKRGGRIILREKAAKLMRSQQRERHNRTPPNPRSAGNLLYPPVRQLGNAAAWCCDCDLHCKCVCLAVFPQCVEPVGRDFQFHGKALIAFAMTLLIISGEIDLSVAAIIALASTAMGAAAQAGVGTPGLVFIGIGTGLVCGAINGGLVAGLKLPSIVVTIGTMSLFRGISYIVLGDKAYGGYPASFAYFGQGYVFWVFSFEFVLFIVAAIIFGVLLHCTSFGRRIYAIGNNEFAARFSGIPVERMKFTLFC